MTKYENPNHHRWILLCVGTCSIIYFTIVWIYTDNINTW